MKILHIIIVLEVGLSFGLIFFDVDTDVKLFLFDIDGTLVRTAGAGKRSMEIAFEQIYGITNGFSGIHMMGRTDPAILRESLGNHGLTPDAEDFERFRELYFKTLESEILQPREGKRVCAGIRDLLDVLKDRSDVLLGLLTGNWRTSALLKLRYFSLDAYFKLGAFADDSEDRNALVPVAVERARELLDSELSANDAIVIGDTPLDVACAKPHGAVTVAVATGFHALEALEATEADFVFKDLSDTAAVVQQLLPV